MDGQTIDHGSDSGKNVEAPGKTGADTLRQEFIASKNGPGEKVGAAPAKDNLIVESKASEERRAQESNHFGELYKQQNFQLDPLKPGWGPFQSLQQMSQEHKIDLSEEQIHSASQRIRDRDFKEWGRHHYSTKDTIMLWTDKEIDQRVQETVNRVKGIDVSSHQGTIDWEKVKDAGYQFAFLKATEGIDWVDSTFAANRKGARDAGLKVGYYHYFRPNDTVDEQVKNFVSTVGKAEPDALRLVIDTEDPKIWKPYSVEQRNKMIVDWCQKVQKQLGVKPSVLVYGSPNFFDETLQNNAKLGKFDLWIANYNVPEPTIPKPWSKWTYWQYSEKGKVPGIEGTGVDLDMYNGSNPSIMSKPRHHR